MPRHYKRTTNIATYSEAELKEALAQIASGKSVKSAEREYGISAKTLRRHRDGKVLNPGKKTLGSCRPTFNVDQENELVRYIQEMEKALFGLSTKDLRRLAFDYAEKLQVPHKFNSEQKLAGEDWFWGFLRRHPSLSIRKPEGTNLSRAVGFNKPQVKKFFDNYRELLTSSTYSPIKIWNMDETGISCVQTPGKIIATKGKRCVGKMTSGERGKNVTVICAVSAAGQYIPPMFIFPRKRMVEALMKHSPAGAVSACTQNGWTDEECFIKWLVHFINIVKPTPLEKHILLLDGHHSHKTLAAVEMARENGIEIITFPPHCTHKMQPLDVSFFKALKSAYNGACDSYMVSNRGMRITMYEITEIFATAYNRVSTIEKAVNGFMTCGLWPFQPDIFSDDDFFASNLTDEPDPSLNPIIDPETINPSPENPTPSSLVSSTAMTIPFTESIFPVIEPFIPDQENSINYSETVTLPVSPAPINSQLLVKDIAGEDPLEGTSNLQQHLSTAKSVLDVQPIKSLTKRTRKRKSERSERITSTPYKEQLLEKSNAKKEKLKPKKTRKTNVKKNLFKVKCEESESEEEYPCLVCMEPFSNSASGEGWIQCIVCNKWAHFLCSDESPLYTCQNCNSDSE